MPTNQQRRDAAKRKLERQLVRREEQARSRHRRTVIASIAVGVVVIAGVIWLISSRKSVEDNAAGGDSSSSASSAAAPTTPCSYTATGQPAAREVQPPNNLNPAREGTVDVTINLGQGPVNATLNRALAPCAVNAFVSLASQKFYDDTPCHRLTDLPNFQILQCGDPSGTGRGGPGYEYANESSEVEQSNVGTLQPTAQGTDGATSSVEPAPTTDAQASDASSSAEAPTSDGATSDTGTAAAPSAPNHYPVGTLAMAATAPSAKNGSQFFIVYGETTIDDTAYTKIGTVTPAGVSLVEQIAAKGTVANADGVADKPAESVNISSVVVPGDAVSAEAPPSSSPAEELPGTDLVPTGTIPADAVPTDATVGETPAASEQPSEPSVEQPTDTVSTPTP